MLKKIVAFAFVSLSLSLFSCATLFPTEEDLAARGIYRDLTIYAKVWDNTRLTQPGASPDEPSRYGSFVIIRDKGGRSEGFYYDAVVEINGLSMQLDADQGEEKAASFRLPEDASLILSPGKTVKISISHSRFAAPLVLEGVIPPNPVNLTIDKPLEKPNTRSSIVLDMDIPEAYGIKGLYIGGQIAAGEDAAYVEGWIVTSLPFTFSTVWNGKVADKIRVYGKYDVNVYFPDIGPTGAPSYLRMLSRLTNVIEN